MLNGFLGRRGCFYLFITFSPPKNHVPIPSPSPRSPHFTRTPTSTFSLVPFDSQLAKLTSNQRGLCPLSVFAQERQNTPNHPPNSLHLNLNLNLAQPFLPPNPDLHSREHPPSSIPQSTTTDPTHLRLHLRSEEV